MGAEKEERKGRQTVSIYPEQELLKRINDYWHKKQFMNRSSAIIDLIEKGLKSVESEEKNT